MPLPKTMLNSRLSWKCLLKIQRMFSKCKNKDKYKRSQLIHWDTKAKQNTEWVYLRLSSKLFLKCCTKDRFSWTDLVKLLLPIYMRRRFLGTVAITNKWRRRAFRIFERLKEVPNIRKAAACEGERLDTKQIELKKYCNVCSIRRHFLLWCSFASPFYRVFIKNIFIYI